MIKPLLALALGVLLAVQSFAAIDVYEFSSEDHRKRYQKFTEELRCPKCKNQNLAGTNSQIATDLRRELHRLIVEDKTDAEILDFMVSRYGDFVLYRPPVQGNTIALWAAPIVFMLAGGVTIGAIVLRRRRTAPGLTEDLSDEEKARINKLFAGDGDSSTK